MRDFVSLYDNLDQTTSTNRKVSILSEYLKESREEDAIWAIALLVGRRPKRTVQVGLLRKWAAELAGLPDWLFEETYHTVGDLAETIALVLPEAKHNEESRLGALMLELIALEGVDEDVKKEFILGVWGKSSLPERYIFNKLITGGFRVGVSEKLVFKAIGKAFELPENVVQHRLMGLWEPAKTTLAQLLYHNTEEEDLSKPYPFMLAYPLETEISALGEIQDWVAEWKWDGIRAQVIKRKREVFIWTRGEDLATDKFPEIRDSFLKLPDFDGVLDGEILVFKNDTLGTFNDLQTRIGRKLLSKKVLAEHPVIFRVYDVLEYKGEDLRAKPLKERKAIISQFLKPIISDSAIQISEQVQVDSWEALTQLQLQARQFQAEGFMLKSAQSVYETGRKKGGWWKWKVAPLSIDAVMIYAQRGHGRRANLFTDFTFAVWENENYLVPFTKAYSGLTDKELAEVDAFVKKHTIDKFGPVRSVKAELVFEIGFEGINASPRHKSGIALRFPRILRWRKDKLPQQADNLETLKGLLSLYGDPSKD